MSKERELLTELEWKIETYMESNYWPNIHLDLDKIKEFLAQEPDTKMTWYQNGYEQAKKDLKQQPLSDEEIQNITKSTDILYVATGDGDYGSKAIAEKTFIYTSDTMETKHVVKTTLKHPRTYIGTVFNDGNCWVHLMSSDTFLGSEETEDGYIFSFSKPLFLKVMINGE